MRVARLLLIAMLSCGALLATSSAAGAVSANAKTCKTLKALDKDLSKVNVDDADSFDQDAFGDIGNAFEKAAKKSPAKLKSALNTIGDVYTDMGDSDNYVDALQAYGRNGQKYAKAFGTYAKFLSTSCF
jgi:hypothetical protein